MRGKEEIRRWREEKSEGRRRGRKMRALSMFRWPFHESDPFRCLV